VIEAVRQAILALTDKNGGTLRAEEVIAAARDRRSPLHAVFEWDDKKAADQHRLATARGLIRQVRIDVVMTELTMPHAVPMFGKNARDGGYATLDWLRQDDDLSREAAIAEFQKASKALRRAQAIAIQLNLGTEAIATIEAMVLSIRREEQVYRRLS
jgi:hypothetical protein